MADLVLGAFARMWARGTAEQVAVEMRAAGLATAQWNFSAIGLPSISSATPPTVYQSVRRAFEKAEVGLWGMSCTYNVTHPDRGQREQLESAAATMIARAPLLGVTAVSVCAGSRNANGWAYHPDNLTESAWSDMRAGLEKLLEVASAAGVVIAVEPEGGTILRDATCGSRLLDELGSDCPLGVIIDSWNLVTGDTREPEVVLEEAFRLLGRRTVALHAKDPLGRKFGGPVLDYPRIAALQRQFAPDTPVIIQDVEEADIRDAMAFLRAAWAEPASQEVSGSWP